MVRMAMTPAKRKMTTRTGKIRENSTIA